MAKSDQTKQLERDVFDINDKLGTFGCFEVSIGFEARERVDYLTYDTKGIWRCYEIKVSTSDFFSKAKLTFVGHYNYFVLTSELFEQVKNDIPSHIGVYVGRRNVKRAKKQVLGVKERVLKDSMIRSLTRESDKFFKNNNPDTIRDLKRKINQLEIGLRQEKLRRMHLMEVGRRKFGRTWHRELEGEM